MRQVPDKSDSIGEKGIATAPEIPSSGAGVEGGKKFVLSQDSGIGQSVHQSGLTGIRIADNPDCGNLSTTGDLTFLPGQHFRELGLKVLNSMDDQTTVFFKLLLTRPTHTDPAFVSREVSPHSFQAWQSIFKLRQFDLKVRFVGAGSRCENIQNHFRPVDHLHVQSPFQITGLARCKIVVEDHKIGFVGFYKILEFFHLTLAQVSGYVNIRPLLNQRSQNGQASRFRQPSNFVKRIVRVKNTVRQQGTCKDAPLATLLALIATQ